MALIAYVRKIKLQMIFGLVYDHSWCELDTFEVSYIIYNNERFRRERFTVKRYL